MDTRTFISPAKRVTLLRQITPEEWEQFSEYQFVAVAGDSPRILDGGDDEESLIERMEVDPSVQSFFVTRCRASARQVPTK